MICEHGSYEGKGVLDFSTNVYEDVRLPPEVYEKYLAAFDDLPRYPERNSDSLKQEIAERLCCSSRNVLVSNGSMALIRLIAQAFCRRRLVLLPQPTFCEYEFSSKLFGARLRFYNLREEKDFSLDNAFLEAADECEVVFLCNPNNPTSRLAERKLVEELHEFYESKGGLLVVDETYYELSDSYTLAEKAAESCSLVVLRSLKALGLCGLRVGYAIGNSELLERLERLKPPWDVNVVAQRVGLPPEGFVEELRKEVRKNRELLVQGLRKLGLRVVPPEASFVLVDLRPSGLSSDDLCASLMRRMIAVRNCKGFRNLGTSYVRIGVKRKEKVERLLSAMEDVLAEGHREGV